MASSTPLHIKIASQIRNEVMSGNIQPGQSIGSESELCSRYGISRGPVRQALDALVKERLIFRLPGKGTFVKEQIVRPEETERQTVRVGVFVDAPPDMQGCAFILEMIQGLNTAAGNFHPRCKLSFEFHEFSGEMGRRFLENRDMDGFLFIPLGRPCLDFLSSLRPGNTKPVVSFFRPLDSHHISQFYVDHQEGAFRAADFLLRQGHRDIGMVLVSPLTGRFDSRERFEGYKKALIKAGVPVSRSLVVETDLSAAGIKHALYSLLENHLRPTALMIGGQALVNPCLRSLQEFGLRIPEDISVIAFDDTIEALLHDPPLTVVKQPFERGTRLALERLVAEIKQIASTPVDLSLKPELVIRDSCHIRKGETP